jgi:hypothetical protein
VSTRTDLARRLELSQVEEVGAFVTGRASGMAVSLEGAPPFSACVVDLGTALPIARLVMRAGDLNHPDAVETGDARFDEAMQVTALASYAPTLQRLLSERSVRDALLEFFKRHPDASFHGSRLHVPVTGGVTQQLIGEALTIAQTVAERFAQVGFLESEEPAKLPRSHGLNRVGTREKKLIRFAVLVGGSALAYLGFAALFGLQADAFGLWAGILFLGAGVSASLLMNAVEGP